MREDALVTTRRSEADRRDVYYSLDVSRLRQRYLEAGQELHPTLGNARLSASSTPQLQPHRVLFVCTHNSARSQMAEGLLRHLSDGKLEVFSAGSHPTHVHPDAVRAMNQFGIDITHQRSRSISDVMDIPFDYVITVCDKAREVCPTFPSSGAQLHWGYPDPVAVENEQERSAMFKQTAQQLQSRIEHFLSSLAALSEHNEDLT
jgi:protein-tyrosine-phosphatase